MIYAAYPCEPTPGPLGEKPAAMRQGAVRPYPRGGDGSAGGKKGFFRRIIGSLLVLAYFGAVMVVGLVEGKHLERFKLVHGSPGDVIARSLGFGLERISIVGTDQLWVSEILTAAQISPKGSLPFLDVEEARLRLQRLPLVRTATVQKFYPSSVVITVEERTPHAIWQKDGEVYVIASDGAKLDLMQDERFLGLPFVVGEGANTRIDEYVSLLLAAGPLKKRITAGTFVAGRRWTLKMDNGMDVRLPEYGAVDAVKRLVELEKSRSILSKDILAVDLRLPDRLVVRLSEQAAGERAKKLKDKVVRGRGVQT